MLNRNTIFTSAYHKSIKIQMEGEKMDNKKETKEIPDNNTTHSSEEIKSQNNK